jgi:hypothetical protein
MNSAELSTCLGNHPLTANIFRGVWAANEIPPNLENLPAGIVVNTDRNGQPGAHWVAFYQETPEKIEYFDSYGREIHKNIASSQLLNGKVIIKQDSILQSNISTVCGQYCMFFLLKRASGTDFSSFVKTFSSNTLTNDRLVCKTVNFEFKLEKEIVDAEFLLKQL